MIKLTRTRAALAAGLTAALAATLVPAAAQAATTPSCSGLQIIYARGTLEVGTYGFVLGDTLVADLQKDVPGTTGSALNYPANLASGSPEKGNIALVSYLEAQSAACPNQQFVLAGYSQGADVIAESFGLNTTDGVLGDPSVAQIPAALASRISAVITFGPPYTAIGESIPAPYAGVLDQFCSTSDAVCTPKVNLLTGLLAHLVSYQTDLSAAAAYAAKNYTSGVHA